MYGQVGRVVGHEVGQGAVGGLVRTSVWCGGS